MIIVKIFTSNFLFFLKNIKSIRFFINFKKYDLKFFQNINKKYNY
jgi:hypothetical protein